LYDADAKERILAEFRRKPDRERDGTATWSLTTLQRALRRAPDGLPSVSTYTIWLVLHEAGLRFGPGIGCRGSRRVPTVGANGWPAVGQYKPSPDGGYDPWALQVLEFSAGRIVELTFFLDTARLFPLFGLPARLDG